MKNVVSLAKQVETAGVSIDAALAAQVCSALRAERSDLAISEEDLLSPEALLHLICRIAPGWIIHLRGHAEEPDGRWTCNLRRSDSQDNDPFIGTGKGPDPAVAMLAAALRTASFINDDMPE